MEDTSLWKRLSRLFRSGPVVRHKIARAERPQPTGTASAYRREINSLYVTALSTYGQYERLARLADFCLAGETGVAVVGPEGSITIAELVRRFAQGEQFNVLSYDIEKQRIVTALVFDARMTGFREIWEVTLDNGKVVRCTDNHPLMLRDGTFRRCDQLTAGTALMPFRRAAPLFECYVDGDRSIVSVVKTDKIEQVYDLTVPDYHNFALTDGNALCSMVWSHNSEMDLMPEIHSALDIYADEVTAKDERGRVINIVSDDDKIREVLEELFYDIVDIDFNLWGWVRNLCKWGDFVLFVDASEENGILNLLPIPINEIERDEGFDRKDPFAVRFRWLTQGNKTLENWQVVHFRLLGNDAFLPYGCSIIEAARRVWRQLILIEDAMLTYRMVRAPERRVYTIPVGNMPNDAVDQHMEEVKNKTKRNTVVDAATGRIDLRYSPLPVRRTTLVPLLDGRALSIETLAREYDDGKENWVYSIDDVTGQVVPGRVTWCGRNYSCGNMRRVWLDDGTFVDVAPEHSFIMRDGSRRRADQLASGDGLMPFYTRTSSMLEGDLLNGYEQVYDPKLNRRIYTHRFVADATRVDEKPVDAQIHHADFRKRNNNPTNLVEMSRDDHLQLHRDHVEKFLNRPEQLEEKRQRWIAWNKSPEKRLITLATNKKHDLGRRMAVKYNRSALHAEHNATRRAKMRASWTRSPSRRDELSARMRWNVDNRVVTLVFELLKNNPAMTRRELIRAMRSSTAIKEALVAATPTSRRNVDTIGHWIVAGKLVRSGILVDAGWTTFKNFVLTNEPPLNHIVLKVEELSDIDDVYCMTVVGPRGEDDRHNFAVLSSYEPGKASSRDGVFVTNSVEDDIYLPSRGPENTPSVTNLPGGQFTGVIDDVQYIQNKMFAALKVPKAYLNHEGDVGSKALLSQTDVRFAKTIERIQKIVIAELNKIAIIHLFINGYRGDDLVNFWVTMANPSTISEQQRLELWRLKFEVAGMAQEGIFDRGTIQRRIFNLKNDEIEGINVGRRFDKLQDVELEGITAQPQPGQEPTAGGDEGGIGGPPGMPQDAGAGASEPVPGEAELPDTLGGKPGGALSQGVERDGVPLLERAGDRKQSGAEKVGAIVAVDKGKDAFATGEDAHTLVFGTEKQTASDPFDQRAMRRIVTRPFSEQADEVEELCSEIIRLVDEDDPSAS